jgi:predicted small secreted protein
MMKAKYFFLGLLVGMAAAVIVTETCPPVKNFLAKGKKKLRKVMQDDD